MNLFSFYLNVFLITFIVFYVIYKLNNREYSEYPKYYFERLKHLNTLPINDSSIVFFGDSFVEQCEWNELMENSNVINRGISYDNIRGLKHRIIIINNNISKLFILIGINDIIKSNNINSLMHDFKELTNTITTRVQPHKIYIFSLLPTHKQSTNYLIKKFNEIIRDICILNHINFINLYDHFLVNNILNENYTYDGLHLNNNGYLKIKSILKLVQFD